MTSGRRVNWIKLAPYLFTAPFLVSFALFFVYPIIDMVAMGFQRVEGLYTTTYVGLDNYRRIFIDQHVTTALLNSLGFTAGIVLINVTLPILLAVLLNSRHTPFRNAFRSALYLPALTSIIVAGIFFRLFFGGGADTPLNKLMSLLRLPTREWLYDTKPIGVLALVVTSTWRWLGTNIIYFLCGLQSIPEELYEAASIDGANAWRKLLHITIPGLKPILVFVVTVLTYGGLRMFGESYVLWVNGKTPGDVGLTLVLYIYKTAFTQYNMGYASALSVTLLLALIAINLLYTRFLGIGRREG